MGAMARGEGGGPKTDEGKALVSRNAVRHGLTSPAPVVEEFEDPEEWEAFALAIVEDLRPEGAVQRELAERIASLKWRLRRITRYETAEARSNYYATEGDFLVYRMLHKHEEFPPEPTPEHEEIIDRMAARRSVPNDSSMQRIARYETHLSKQLYRALWELRLLQKYREEGTSSVWVEVTRAK